VLLLEKHFPGRLGAISPGAFMGASRGGSEASSLREELREIPSVKPAPRQRSVRFERDTLVA